MIQVDESFILVLKRNRAPIFLVRPNIDTLRNDTSNVYGINNDDRD